MSFLWFLVLVDILEVMVFVVGYPWVLVFVLGYPGIFCFYYVGCFIFLVESVEYLRRIRFCCGNIQNCVGEYLRNVVFVILLVVQDVND